MKKKWINKTSSFYNAQELDDKYYISKTPKERLSDIQICREQYFLINKKAKNESRKRLQRVVRIIKQT